MGHDSRKSPKVLITAVGAPPGLNALRALYEIGTFKLVAADADKTVPGLYQFDGVEAAVLPNASEREEYISTVIDLINKKGINVLLPCLEEEILLLTEFRSEIEQCGVKILVPDYATLLKATNKGAAVLCAKENGIDLPISCVLRKTMTKDMVISILDEFEKGCAFPWISKPSIGHGMNGVLVIKSREEALDHLSPLPCDTVVQEFIPGKVGSMHVVGLIYNANGDLKRTFASRSIKTLYPEGGPATAGISLYEPELILETERLMKSIGKWQGPACVEWMRDPRNGKMKFIEINPRLWGYGYLAVASGSHFPSAVVNLALGNDIGQDTGYNAGVVLMRSTYDIILPTLPFEMQ